MSLGNPGTSDADTPAFAGKSCATSPAPKPATGTSPFGRFAFSAAFASGTPGTSVFEPSSGVAGGGGSLVGQPTAFGATPTKPPVTTGTSMPAYSAFREVDPSNPGCTLEYQSITAMPAYESVSLEALRVQDYQQNRKGARASSQTSSATPATPGNVFARPIAAQQPTTGSIFGGGTAGAFGISTAGQNTSGVGTSTNNFSSWGFRPKKLLASERKEVKPSTFGHLGPVLDRSKLERIEELLRRLLLGEEVVNTQFHLFSARSSKSGRVTKPRVVCANNSLLAKSSTYFLDLLSSDVNPSDRSLMDLMGDNDVPDSAVIDDYGYESDSDLDDCDDLAPIANTEALKDQSAGSTFGPAGQPKDGSGLSEDGHELAGFLKFAGGPSMGKDKPLSDNSDGGQSAEINRREATNNKASENRTAMRLRSLGSRHILVKDTAFHTWYTLLYYLYTGKFSFLPLSSTMAGGQRKSPPSPLDEPRCSAKSMYRLASKVGLEHLRYQALAHIRSNLSEHNILKELPCSLVSEYPELLEMELDTLYFHIASPSVVANFAAFAQRISNYLPHGGDIIFGIYTRVLKNHYTFALKPAAPALVPGLPRPPERVEQDVNVGIAPEAEDRDENENENENENEDEDERGSPLVNKLDAQAGSLPSGCSEPTLSVPSQASATMATPIAVSAKEPDAGGKGKATAKCK